MKIKQILSILLVFTIQSSQTGYLGHQIIFGWDKLGYTFGHGKRDLVAGMAIAAAATVAYKGAQSYRQKLV